MRRERSALAGSPLLSQVPSKISLINKYKKGNRRTKREGMKLRIMEEKSKYERRGGGGTQVS